MIILVNGLSLECDCNATSDVTNLYDIADCGLSFEDRQLTLLSFLPKVKLIYLQND